MGLGPIEVLVAGLPDDKLNDGIVSALEDVVRRGIVSVVDGLVVTRSSGGEVEFSEIDDGSEDVGRQRLAKLMGEANGLLNDEDAGAFAATMEPGDSVAVLVLEHIWAGPFHESIADAGGSLLADMRVPGSVVDEVLDAARPASRIGRPGLIGTMARSAVGAGTARAAVGAGNARPSAGGNGDDRIDRVQAAVDQQKAIQAAYEARSQIADLGAQLSAHQPAPDDPPEREPTEDMTAKLTQLAELHKANVINDDEFEAAKAKLLA